MVQKQDLLTKELFVPKRISQKFANSKNRIKYYNKMANDLRHSAMFINKPLYNNLRILNKLLKGKKEFLCHKEYLKGMGYSFSVLTHYQSYKGTNHSAIYNFIILSIDKENVRIVKIDNND